MSMEHCKEKHGIGVKLDKVKSYIALVIKMFMQNKFLCNFSGIKRTDTFYLGARIWPA